MPVSLPLELINSILSHLSGTPSICTCALICHSWLPGARYQLLPPPKTLYVNRTRLSEFLYLYNLPGSTLPLIFFSTLHLSQWQPRFRGPFDDQWADTSIQRWLLRNVPFPTVTRLFLEELDCSTLSPPALASLTANYPSVTELELRFIRFTTPTLCSLLAALPSLHTLIIRDCVDSATGPITVNSPHIAHPRLSHLVVPAMFFTWKIRFFATAVQYTSGLTAIDVKLPFPACHACLEFTACSELLDVAGAALRVFTLRPAYYVHDEVPPVGAISFDHLVRFPHNPSLEALEINPIKQHTLGLLMQGLKTKPRPRLRRITLAFDADLESQMQPQTWDLVDETLSDISMSSNCQNKLIIKLLPPVSVGSDSGSVVNTQRDQMELVLLADKVRGWIPRAAECWEIEVVAE